MNRNLYILLTLHAVISLTGFEVSAQRSAIDSLKNILNTVRNDTVQINTMNALSRELLTRGDYGMAIKAANDALSMCDKVPARSAAESAKQLIARQRSGAYNVIGVAYEKLGDYQKAMESYFKGLKIAEELGDKTGVATVLGNIGIIYKEQGDYPHALEYYFKALKLDEETGNKNGVARHLGNIGVVYRNQGEYSKALDCYFKVLKMAEELGNKNAVTRNLSNIGNVYYSQGNYSKALDYYFKALTLQTKSGNKNGIAINLGNIGSAYDDQGNSSKAFEYYFKALKMSEELGDKNGIAINLGNIGALYVREKKFTEARKYLNQALAIDKETGSKEGMKYRYGDLSTLDSALGNYKSAYENYRMFIVYRDSMINEENTEKTVQAEMNFAFEKKQAVAKAEQEQKDAVALKELQKQTIQRNGFIAGFALMLALAGVSYRNYRNKRKAHEIIAAQKTLVEEKNKDILDSINYAKRIQTALLKEENYVSRHLPPHFILYKPKDIISGDFYWAHEKNNFLYIAAADCTGHGVPGAMMSMLGIAFLNEISSADQLFTPAQILDKLRERVIKELGYSGQTKDGMDISLVRLNLSTRELDWSGANNPLWIIQKSTGGLNEIKPDKQPVGFSDNPKPFINHTIQLNNEDKIYIFTDGFADQFGGEKGKKFKYARLKETLLSVTEKQMQEQKQILNDAFDLWKGNLEQVDDVCVIGLSL